MIPNGCPAVGPGGCRGPLASGIIRGVNKIPIWVGEAGTLSRFHDHKGFAKSARVRVIDKATLDGKPMDPASRQIAEICGGKCQGEVVAERHIRKAITAQV